MAELALFFRKLGEGEREHFRLVRTRFRPGSGDQAATIQADEPGEFSWDRSRVRALAYFLLKCARRALVARGVASEDLAGPILRAGDGEIVRSVETLVDQCPKIAWFRKVFGADGIHLIARRVPRDRSAEAGTADAARMGKAKVFDYYLNAKLLKPEEISVHLGREQRIIRAETLDSIAENVLSQWRVSNAQVRARLRPPDGDAGRPRQPAGSPPTLARGLHPEPNHHFQGRERPLNDLRLALGDRQKRLVIIWGPGGIGKSELACAISDELRRNRSRLPGTRSGTAGSDGISYLDCKDQSIRRPTVENIVELVGRFLPGGASALSPDSTCAPGSPLERAHSLLSRMQEGAYLLLLDNLEAALDEDRRIRDQVLAEFIDHCLGIASGLRILATTQRVPRLRTALMHGVAVLSLDQGIPEEQGVALLTGAGKEWGLLFEPEESDDLGQIVRDCHGHPYRLWRVLNVLQEDRTLRPGDLLRDGGLRSLVRDEMTRMWFERVPTEQRRVIEALAVFDAPVQVGAIASLLTGIVDQEGVESACKRLTESSLVKIHRDHGAGGRIVNAFALHPFDARYAYDQIPDSGGTAGATKRGYHLRAARYFRDAEIGQVRRQDALGGEIAHLKLRLAEVYHLCRSGDVEDAWRVFAPALPALISAGSHEDVVRFCRDLAPGLSPADAASCRAILAESLYQGLDAWEEAAALAAQVREDQDTHNNDQATAIAAQVEAHIAFERGRFEEACEAVDQNLERYNRLGAVLEAANTRNTLGVFLDAQGRWAEASGEYKQAEAIFADEGRDRDVGRVRINRSAAEFFLQGPDRALVTCRAGLDAFGDDARCQEVAYGTLNELIFHLARGNLRDARPCLDRCDRIVSGESWFQLNLAQMRAILYWFDGRTEEALALIDGVLAPFQDLQDNWGWVDAQVNKGCILHDLRRGSEAVLHWRRAWEESLRRNYRIGSLMAGYLLVERGEPAPAARELAIEFQNNNYHSFRRIFMPCYALILRSNLAFKFP